MENENQPPPLSSMEKPLLERLGLSGQLMGGGAILGIVVLFMPLMSFSVNMQGAAAQNPVAAAMTGGLNISRSVSCIEDWRGKLALLAYVGAIILVLAVYPTLKPEQKNLAWGGLGAGGLAALLALWQLFLVRDVGGVDMAGMGSIKSSIGFGGFLNLIAAGVVSYGGFLKAKEERLL